MTDFTRLYSSMILKDICKQIVQNEKKKEKAAERKLKAGETIKVRTMRHWKALSDIEFYVKENEKRYKELSDLDNLVDWSSKLHQDRYSFMQEKYSIILENYLMLNSNWK